MYLNPKCGKMEEEQLSFGEFTPGEVEKMSQQGKSLFDVATSFLSKSSNNNNAENQNLRE